MKSLEKFSCALRDAGCHYYTPIRKLGSGSFAKVYLVHDDTRSRQVAIKHLFYKVNNDDDNDEGVPSWVIREIAIHKNIKSHPHIIPLLRLILDLERHQCFLVMEAAGMSLETFLQTDTFLMSWQTQRIQQLLVELLLGVQHLHCNNIVHRDLTPANILVDNDGGRVRIADFGLSRSAFPVDTDSKYTNKVVALLYRAPELLIHKILDGGGSGDEASSNKSHYSTEIDMWSVGCILGEMLLPIQQTEDTAFFNGKDTAYVENPLST